jgi:hypothetical protein
MYSQGTTDAINDVRNINILKFKKTSGADKRHFQQYFSHIVAVSFIDIGNRSIHRNPLTYHKSLANCII